uniref:Macrophage mannose receptor 1-like isoform X2 n=1 Tax=Centropages dorsispinatus TaxID=1239308 RepID=A0A0U2T8M5_9MAXI|nr:macrophage mannose receptor 1-like isoform X2 [Centropages dorsispinatus]
MLKCQALLLASLLMYSGNHEGNADIIDNYDITGSCDFEYVHPITKQTSCYLYKDEHVNWFTANKNCNENGGLLMNIETPYENNFIKKHVAKFDRNIWLGLRKTNVGDFIYSTVVRHFTDFHPDEGKPGDKGDGACVHMFTSKKQFLWNDIPCTNTEKVDGKPFAYICEFRRGEHMPWYW